jgi:hypothetical protein
MTEMLAKQQSLAKRFLTLWALYSHAIASFMESVIIMALMRSCVVSYLSLLERSMPAVS